MAVLLYGEQQLFLKKLKIELSYDPAAPLLGIYPGKMKTLRRKDTCITQFTEAVFTIARTRKQVSVYPQMNR